MEIFPNPADGEFELSTNVKNIISIELLDIFGKRISISYDEISDNQFKIKVTQKPASGIYHLEITTNDRKVFHRKLVLS